MTDRNAGDLPASPDPWSTAADQALAQVYSRIPEVACQGLCAHDCTDDIGMGPRERQRLRRAGVQMPPREQAKERAAAHGPSPCPALADGRCTAYEARPAICRIYGVTEGLRCPYGCPIASRRPLTMAEGFALVDAAAAAGTARQPMNVKQAENALRAAPGARIRARQLRDQANRRQAAGPQRDQAARRDEPMALPWYEPQSD
ncbi:YkgJ family cysteine cluster protein [Microbispora sp. NBRC 16548]|uniref:YkgJ family cysteine cluster protein n=1 Tax=Microbispora sp. NBRC 16548 TaxID=3030994 RepID=UPI00255222EF|nr:YkgJ family cysteine cluster protein [Microbispora sp. NBRC 16548]